MSSFLDYEGTDPASAAREAAEALTSAKRALEASGVAAFLRHSSSLEEFDERAKMAGASGAAVEALRREFAHG